MVIRGSVNKNSKVYCVGDFCDWKGQGMVEMQYSEEEDLFDNKRCCFVGSIPVKPGCFTRYFFIVDGKLDYSSVWVALVMNHRGLFLMRCIVDPME